MKKIISIFCALTVLLLGAVDMVCAEIVDDETQKAMSEFDTVMAEIGRLPGEIDEDICGKDWASYRVHMTELAQYIIEANTIIKNVDLYYPMDLWIIYNRISSNPICGAAASAADAFGVADISRISNEEKMGIRENDDICMCWNIATGRDEPTGFMKDGQCRCTYGINAYDPNIGKN